MIREIAKAITDKYNDAPIAALTGGLYFTMAPDTVDDPYAVFTWNASDTVDQMGGQSDRYEIGDITFTTFAKQDDGGSAIVAISAALENIFDWTTLTISGFSAIAMQRTGTGVFGMVDDIMNTTSNYRVWFDH